MQKKVRLEATRNWAFWTTSIVWLHVSNSGNGGSIRGPRRQSPYPTTCPRVMPCRCGSAPNEVGWCHWCRSASRRLQFLHKMERWANSKSSNAHKWCWRGLESSVDHLKDEVSSGNWTSRHGGLIGWCGSSGNRSMVFIMAGEGWQLWAKMSHHQRSVKRDWGQQQQGERKELLLKV